jgi:hypothetical protein
VSTQHHHYVVTVSGCTREQADQVIAERIDHDEDYGFPYTLCVELEAPFQDEDRIGMVPPKLCEDDS